MDFRGIKIFLISALIIIIAAVSFFIVSINIFSNNILEKNLEKYTGLKFEFVEPEIKLDYHFNLKTKAKEINVYNKEKTVKFAKIKDINVNLKPFSLLLKKIDIEDFSVQNIEINVLRNNEGHIEGLKEFKKQDFKIEKLKTQIGKFEFNFYDDYKVKSKVNLSFENCKIKYNKSKKILEIDHQGQIKTNINGKEEVSDFIVNANDGIINVNLENLNLHLFSDIAKQYISKEIASLSGNMDLVCKIENAGNLAINITNPTFNLTNGSSITPYKNIKITSTFKGDIDKFDIKDLKILSNNLDIELSGKVIRPFEDNIKLDLTTTFKNTQINNLFVFLPDNLIYYNPKGIPYLKKTNFHGVANGTFTLKYSPIDMKGDVKVTNVHIPQYPKSYKPNDVYLSFKKDKLYVDTKVYTTTNEYVEVKGYSNLDDSLSGNYDAKSTPKIDLKFAQPYLVDVQQIIGFNLGPVPIMKIEGYGNIDIKAKGTLKDPLVNGVFQAYNASVEISGVDAKLTNGSCKLVFNNRDLFFQEMKANLDNAYFFMSGKSNSKGDVDVDVKVTNAFTSKVLKIFNNSIISLPYTILTKDIAATSGKMSFLINLKGNVPNFEAYDFLLNLKPSGSMEFFGNKVIFNNSSKIKNLIGILTFGSKQSGIFEFLVDDSKFNVRYDSSDNLEKIASGEKFNSEFSIASNKIEFQDVVKELKILPDIDLNFYFKTDLKGNVDTSLKNIQNYKINYIKGYLIGLNSSVNKNIHFNSGIIRFKENKMVFDNFDVLLSSGVLKIRGNISEFLSKTPNFNVDCFLNNINLGFLKNIIKINLIAEGGNIELKNDKIKIHNLNLISGSLKTSINAKIDDIYKNMSVNADFSTILNENIIDVFINPFLTYPIKIKENIKTTGKFKGNAQNYSIDFDTFLPKNSDVSYRSANIGDTDFDREITGKINVNQNILVLNNLKLIKYTLNQDKQVSNVSAVLNGKIQQKKDGIYYDNFKIVTSTPMSAQILNLIFKKSLLKKGLFECNLSLNGNILSPLAIGKIDLTNLEIPLYNTQINNIKLKLSSKYIDSEITAKNQKSDFNVLARIKNSLKPPYIIDIVAFSSNNIDVKEILESIPKTKSKSDITSNKDFDIKPSDVVVKNGSFDFKELNFNKINVKNMKGNFTYNNSVFDLQNIVFDIADGIIGANGQYNLNTTDVKLKAAMQNCEANILTKQFLNLQGQIYGKMNGTIDLTAKHLNTPQGIKNLKSDIVFSIDKGKMPKLGSLEYLLRAGNTIKGGFLSLSLNNLFHILTPYKTGEFENIKGSLLIENAKVNNLEILSKGKNLSLYLTGDYDILDTNADVEIYGKLSQKVTNALSAITNASIKQFIGFVGKNKQKQESQYKEYFDKIPSVDSNNENPVYFRAKVLGDINKDDYVKEFVWE